MGSKRVLPPYDANGNGVVIDDRTLDEAKAERLALLAELRWQYETGGTVVAGLPVATDDRSQLKLTGARIEAQADPSYTVNWKTEAGFVTLVAPQIVAISEAVRAHIQSCFDNEGSLSAQIRAATTNTAVDAVDISSGWPA